MSSEVLIAPFQTGLDTDFQPWIIPEDGFTTAENVHVRHGVVEKRSGFREFGQMKTTSTAIAITDITQADPGVVTTGIPHGLTTNEKIYIIDVQGMLEVNDRIYTITTAGPNAFSLGVDTSLFTAYTTGGSVLSIVDATDRVMGIDRFIDADNFKTTLAFSDKRANYYNSASNEFLPLDGADIMSGSDTDFIWGINWQSTDVVNRYYFTNGKAYDGASLDGIRYYDGTVDATTSFTPTLGTTTVPPIVTRQLYGGKLLFVIKQRLVVLNTFENDGVNTRNFPQRARCCAAQAPSNWDDLTPGGGTFVDAPTGQHIISARQIQDQIIVFFTDSVWTLRPVPDPALPFKWEKINDFRACDGKMASVGYDRYAVAFGTRGITATDGVETRRIDDRIQDFAVNEVNTKEFEKIFCERSYANLRSWALYPKGVSVANNAALIFDDESKAYTTYKIDINCLGYGNTTKDLAFEDFTAAADLDLTFEEMGEETFSSFYWQENADILLGGDTSGMIYKMETGTSDNGSDINVVIDSAYWNPYKKEGREARLSYVDIFADTDEKTTLNVEFFKDNEETAYHSQQVNLLPNLNYITSITTITNANPASVTASDHGLSTGDEIFIYLVEGMEEIGGAYTVTVVDSNTITLDGTDSTAFGAYTTGGQLFIREFYRTKTWKRVHTSGIGYQHKIRITAEGIDRPFRIHAFKPKFSPSGKRTIN